MDTNNCIFFFEDSITNRKKLFEKSLLFATHGKVLYIMCEQLSELPELSQDLGSVNKHYMKMISFLYVQNLDSLIESISTILEWQSMPSTIILEDLSIYCDKNIQNACGVVAFLIDTIKNCSVSLKTACRLFISVSKDTVNDDFCNTLKELYNY